MDAPALAVRAAEIKATVRALTSERAKLSPIAVNGHDSGPAARERIGQIDAERSKLMLDLETVEAALASPEFKHAAVLDRLCEAFEKNLPRLRGALGSTLADRYHCLAHADNLLNSGVDITKLPDIIADELCGVTRVREDLEAAIRNRDMVAHDRLSEQPDAKIERLRAELACRERHSGQLQLFVERPPLPIGLKEKLGKLAVKPASDNQPIGARVVSDQRKGALT
jgi:hypothetical protein